MNLNSIEDIKKLKGGIGIDTLEQYIHQLLQLCIDYTISWEEGIEALSDIIALKKHDNSILSEKVTAPILNWITKTYNSSIYEGFPESKDKEEHERVLLLLRVTKDVLFKVHHTTDTIPFLHTVLQNSSNPFETREIQYFLDYIKNLKPEHKHNLDDELLDKILTEVDLFFDTEYKNGENPYAVCGLRETIKEHKLCYSISWCQKKDKYISPAKRSGWVGVGPLMISKNFDLFQRMGSAIGPDWIYLFELDIQNLEEYFYVEVPYQKQNTALLKSVLQCTEEELLDKIDDNENIIFSESKAWIDNYASFQSIVDKLNAEGISCKVQIKTREKIKVEKVINEDNIETEDDTEEVHENLIPLAVNNEWIYKQSIYNKKSEKAKIATIANTVTDTLDLSEHTQYVITEFGEKYDIFHNNKGIIRFKWSQIGIERLFSLQHPYTIDKFPFKYQATTLKHIFSTEDISDTEIITHNVILYKDDELLVIHNKTYTCYRYVLKPVDEKGVEIINNTTTIYIALDIGIVKKTIETPNEIINYELIDQNFN
ncbi:hypothetical protein [Tenacibaculum agarivorans]|uniref:hypothetical protein n=1 Tax=Tenacibaculum agarivorans TaxID=1908389 RepID=UPI00094BC371|nr:hypothetical protein [Tenacibaculum agarivorans]